MKKSEEITDAPAFEPPASETFMETETGDAIEAKPYFLAGAWCLVAFSLYLMAKCVLDIILQRTVLPPLATMGCLAVLVLPVFIIADMMGASYVVTFSYVERRGFFGTRKRFAWSQITKVVLREPWRCGRDIVVEAGRKRQIAFEVGLFWWRPGFFKTAEAIAAIAKLRGIPVRTKWKIAREREEGVEEWFDLGRQNVFSWSKAQLPPRPPSPSDPPASTAEPETSISNETERK